MHISNAIGFVVAATVLARVPSGADQAEDSADYYYHGSQRSPDGRWVAFTKIKRFTSPEAHGDWIEDISLYVRDLRTGRTRRLVRMEGRERVPVTAGWSPDSKRILYWRLNSYGSSSVNADGSGFLDVSLKGGRSRFFGFARRDTDSYVFSPNRRYLAVVEGGLRFTVSEKQIAVFDYRTGKRRWASPSGMASIAPVWSPDSRRLAFVATRDDHPLGDSDDIGKRMRRAHLWIANRDGTVRRQLTHDPRYHEDEPRWSRRGNAIRFVRIDNNEPEKTSDWEVHADGSELTRIRDRQAKR